MKKRIGIGYKNYGKQCPGLEFCLIPKLISWAGLKPKKIFLNSSRLISTNKLQQLKNLATKFYKWPTMITTYQFARKELQ